VDHPYGAKASFDGGDLGAPTPIAGIPAQRFDAPRVPTAAEIPARELSYSEINRFDQSGL
jgi:hypothetical protein